MFKYLSIALLLNGCVVGFQPDKATKVGVDVSTNPVSELPSSDLVSEMGERYHGPNGLMIQAEFLDIGETKHLSNQIVIEGAFYE